MDILQIEPTRYCNKNCETCVRDDLTQIGEISIDTYKTILENNKEENFEILKLQGLGEPFLYSDIDKLTQIARDYNYTNIMTITNGSFPIIGDFDRVVFSINKFTDKDRAISHLINANQSKYNVSINCVLYNQSKRDIDKLNEFAEINGIHIDFTPMELWYDCSHTKYQDQYEMVSSMYERFNLIPEYRINNCEWSINSLYYDYLGRMHPCCIRMTDEYLVNSDFDFTNCCKTCPM